MDLLKKEKHDVLVLRNNIELTALEEIVAKEDKCCFVLSPGPGTPKNAGNLIDIVKRFKGKIPMLGVCLGHQAIIEVHGGKIIKSREVVHGKSSVLDLSGHALFNGLGPNMIIGRYHSLQGSELPAELNILAEYNNIPMIIAHKDLSLIGFQFHPESIMSPMGGKLINNAIEILKEKNA